MKRQSRSYLKHILILSSIISFGFHQSKATHVAGMEMFYRHSVDSSYEFTLIYYRNCLGYATSPPTYVIIQSSASSIGFDSNFTLTRLATTGQGVPPLEPTNMYNCTQRTNLCYEEYVYRGTWNSPGRAIDWKFSYQLCCRDAGSKAFVNLVAGYTYVECGLNNKDFPDYKAKNWSAIWHNRRPNHPGYFKDTLINYFLKILCYGNQYTIDQSVREYQGDSLSYGFYQPQGNGGSPMNYKQGHCFKGCYKGPLPTLNGLLKINPITGIISIVPGKPTGSGIYAIGIEAVEWRNDTVPLGTTFAVIPKRIGYNRRELTIIIDDSSNCRKDSTHIKGYHLYSRPKNNTLKVYFHSGKKGDPNSLLRCNTLSSDGSEFRVVDSSNYVAPFDSTVKTIGILSASWKCVSGYTEVVSLELDQKISCIDYHIILKRGTDLDVIQSECGFWEPEFASGTITTDSIDQVNIGPDTLVCSNKQFTKNLKTDSIYSSYYWNTWDTTQNISVNYARKYWVRVENDFGCISTDTMEIFEEYCKDTTQKDTSNVGIEVIHGFEFKVYPNPVNDKLYINLKGILDSDIQIRLRNMNGQMIFQSMFMNSVQEIDVTNYKLGIYFLELSRNDGERKVMKIMVE